MGALQGIAILTQRVAAARRPARQASIGVTARARLSHPPRWAATPRPRQSPRSAAAPPPAKSQCQRAPSSRTRRGPGRAQPAALPRSACAQRRSNLGPTFLMRGPAPVLALHACTLQPTAEFCRAVVGAVVTYLLKKVWHTILWEPARLIFDWLATIVHCLHTVLSRCVAAALLLATKGYSALVFKLPAPFLRTLHTHRLFEACMLCPARLHQSPVG